MPMMIMKIQLLLVI